VKGTRNYVASGANEIGWKFSKLSYVLISDVVKRDRVKDLLVKGKLRSVIERDHIGSLRLTKSLRGLLGSLKFYLQRESCLHKGKLSHVTWQCKRGLRYAKPPRNADFLCRL
jgi:hypothetical protein